MTRAADASLEKDEVEKAAELLDAVLERDGEHADGWARRAGVHVRAGRHRSALADANRALELEPRHFGALRARGVALRGVRRYEEAIEAMEELLRMHPWASGVVNGIHKTQSSLDAGHGRSRFARGGSGRGSGGRGGDGVVGSPVRSRRGSSRSSSSSSSSTARGTARPAAGGGRRLGSPSQTPPSPWASID